MQFEKGRSRFWLERPNVDKNRTSEEIDDDIRPNAMDQFEFLVRVPSPGLYAIAFTARIDDKEWTRMKGTKEDRERPCPLRWDATTLLEVRDKVPVQVISPRDIVH